MQFSGTVRSLQQGAFTGQGALTMECLLMSGYGRVVNLHRIAKCFQYKLPAEVKIPIDKGIPSLKMLPR